MTNPDNDTDELPSDDQPTELDLAYDRIAQLENALMVTGRRIPEIQRVLHDMLRRIDGIEAFNKLRA